MRASSTANWVPIECPTTTAGQASTRASTSARSAAYCSTGMPFLGAGVEPKPARSRFSTLRPAGIVSCTRAKERCVIPMPWTSTVEAPDASARPDSYTRYSRPRTTIFLGESMAAKVSHAPIRTIPLALGADSTRGGVVASATRAG